jgi:DNA-binding response OmpR family regulator
MGTAFKIFLPHVEAGPMAEQSGITAEAERGRETILVVEDQESVRLFTVAALEEYGYHVIEASNGETAITAAAQHFGEIDLLLTDVVLPGMNGKELSGRLKALRPNLKVLFTSGYTTDVIAHRGVLDHGIAYIPKPFSPDALAAKVRVVLTEPSMPH